MIESIIVQTREVPGTERKKVRLIVGDTTVEVDSGTLRAATVSADNAEKWVRNIMVPCVEVEKP